MPFNDYEKGDLRVFQPGQQPVKPTKADYFAANRSNYEMVIEACTDPEYAGRMRAALDAGDQDTLDALVEDAPIG